VKRNGWAVAAAAAIHSCVHMPKHKYSPMAVITIIAAVDANIQTYSPDVNGSKPAVVCEVACRDEELSSNASGSTCVSGSWVRGEKMPLARVRWFEIAGGACR